MRFNQKERVRKNSLGQGSPKIKRSKTKELLELMKNEANNGGISAELELKISNHFRKLYRIRAKN